MASMEVLFPASLYARAWAKHIICLCFVNKSRLLDTTPPHTHLHIAVRRLGHREALTCPGSQSQPVAASGLDLGILPLWSPCTTTGLREQSHPSSPPPPGGALFWASILTCLPEDCQVNTEKDPEIHSASQLATEPGHSEVVDPKLS